MRELFFVAGLCSAMATSVHPHEFWIEPTPGLQNSERPLDMQVFVGEYFSGERYPFEPRAYAAAYWVGPKTAQALHARSLSDPDLPLTFEDDGLHVLAVSTYETRLVHETVDDFLAFAESIGASDVDRDMFAAAAQATPVPETYRRFSKTLVQHGAQLGADKRLGFEYEWVQSPTGFTLYVGQDTVATQPVDVYCRSSAQPVWHRRLMTDRNGHVPLAPAASDRCLLNAVFLKAPAPGRQWSSTWVSVVWDP